jgi:hypothetical protein
MGRRCQSALGAWKVESSSEIQVAAQILIGRNCLGGCCCSVQLEFKALAYLTDDEKLFRAADKVIDVISTFTKEDYGGVSAPPGMWPVYVHSGTRTLSGMHDRTACVIRSSGSYQAYIEISTTCRPRVVRWIGR